MRNDQYQMANVLALRASFLLLKTLTPTWGLRPKLYTHYLGEESQA